VGRREMRAEKPLVPARLSFYWGLQRFRKEILSLGCSHAITQSPESLLAIARWGLGSIVFMFPGVESPLKISRYAFARLIWPLFDKLLFSAVQNADLLLACADEEAISRLVRRSGGRISREKVVQVPTCVDTEEFSPIDGTRARAELGIPASATVFAVNGRIGWFKGWELLLNAFALLLPRLPGAELLFIGDGEDRPRLELAIASRGLGTHVRITGFQKHIEIARYLNASTVIVCGSFAEGWSVAMLEALACGKPLVSTNVSGVNELIVPGQNGFVVPSRDPAEFADAMEKALQLTRAATVSRDIARRYSMTFLGERLENLWPPLCLKAIEITPCGATQPG